MVYLMVCTLLLLNWLGDWIRLGEASPLGDLNLSVDLSLILRLRLVLFDSRGVS